MEHVIQITEHVPAQEDGQMTHLVAQFHHNALDQEPVTAMELVIQITEHVFAQEDGHLM
jgi:hypothetical protein